MRLLTLLLLAACLAPALSLCDGNPSHDPDGICAMTREEYELLTSEPVAKHDTITITVTSHNVSNLTIAETAVLGGVNDSNQTIKTSSDGQSIHSFNPMISHPAAIISTAAQSQAPAHLGTGTKSVDLELFNPFDADLGGVAKLLSSVFGRAHNIDAPGHWSLALTVTAAQFDAIAVFLASNDSASDLYGAIETGSQVFQTGSYQLIDSLFSNSHQPNSLLSNNLLVNGLDWVINWIHFRLLFPYGVVSSFNDSAIVVTFAFFIIASSVGFVAGRLTGRQRRAAGATRSESGSGSENARNNGIATSTSTASRRHGTGSAYHPRTLFVQFAWGMGLTVLVLSIAGYVHHYNEILRQNQGYYKPMQGQPPPPGCYGQPHRSVWHAVGASVNDWLFRSRGDRRMNECIEWDLAQSSLTHYPNPFIVLTSYLSATMLPVFKHFGSGMGQFVGAFMDEHSVVRQTVMIVVLVVIVLGFFALLPSIITATYQSCCLTRRRTVPQPAAIEDGSDDSGDEDYERPRQRRLTRFVRGMIDKDPELCQQVAAFIQSESIPSGQPLLALPSPSTMPQRTPQSQSRPRSPVKTTPVPRQRRDPGDIKVKEEFQLSPSPARVKTETAAVKSEPLVEEVKVKQEVDDESLEFDDNPLVAGISDAGAEPFNPAMHFADADSQAEERE